MHDDGHSVFAPGSSSLSGVAVVVETLQLGFFGDHLTFRVREQLLGDDEHPDRVARSLAGFGDRGADGQLLHSTSWRFAAGRIVLTYAALPDPDPATATRLDGVGLTAVAAGPLDPSPAGTDRPAVARHACRHLAFLRRTDRVVAASARYHPRLWDLIGRHEPAPAGALNG